MRIIEIKAIIKKITNQSNQIEVFNEPLYNGSAYKIENLKDYIDFLNIISDFNFSGIKKEELSEVLFFKNIPKDKTLGTNDFNTLVSFTNRMNGTMPVFSSIIETLAKDQNQYLINIKLPEKISSLSEVSQFNTKLIEIFKKFDYGTEEINFILTGVDAGSKWYEILLNNNLFDQIAFALDTASRYLGWWEVFKISKEFALNNITFNKNKKEDTKITYEDSLKDEWLNEYVSNNLKKIKNKNGRTDHEIIGKIILGAKDLIELVEEGAELKLSYNPPEYIKEDKNFFEIDYTRLSLPKESNKEIKEQEKLDSPKSKEEKK